MERSGGISPASHTEYVIDAMNSRVLIFQSLTDTINVVLFDHFQGPNGTTLPGPCDSPAVGNLVTKLFSSRIWLLVIHCLLVVIFSLSDSS